MLGAAYALMAIEKRDVIGVTSYPVTSRPESPTSSVTRAASSTSRTTYSASATPAGNADVRHRARGDLHKRAVARPERSPCSAWQTKHSMLKAILTKDSPFYVQFYVSKYCNLSYKMCNIVKANADIAPFSPDKIERIADNLVTIGAGVVLLTGGEPFLRPDIDEIVRVFRSRRLDVRLQTAGLYEKREKIAKCVEHGARDINVSLDSLDERLSDHINGRPGSWRNAMRTISFISRTFPGKDSICALGCVLSPQHRRGRDGAGLCHRDRLVALPRPGPRARRTARR